MVPTTPLIYDPNRQQIPHESINDLPVHRLTDQQIFYPVSESRQFTRVDAGRVFSGAPALERNNDGTDKEEEKLPLTDPVKAANKLQRQPNSIERVGKGAPNDNETQQVLQPADIRIPHPELIMYEKDRLQFNRETNIRWNNHQNRLEDQESAQRDSKLQSIQRIEDRTSHIFPDNSRFEFRLLDVNVSKDTTGPTGRNPNGVGRRYGVPSYDRKKGQVKIPTRVDG